MGCLFYDDGIFLMNPIVIIPARLAATRLPHKPLADIHGKPMVVHAMERALEAGFENVVVACCCEEIASSVAAHGGKYVITDPFLPSGTDRIHVALLTLDKNRTFDVVINLQGDLPLIDPRIIKRVLDPLTDRSSVDMSTLAAPITDDEEINNPNVVKIALSEPDSQGIARAWYFSRQPIPHKAKTYYHHIGVYAYRREALERFVKLPPSTLERQERLEQLRALEAGMRIDVALIKECPQSVDTLEDLEKVREKYQRSS